MRHQCCLVVIGTVAAVVSSATSAPLRERASGYRLTLSTPLADRTVANVRVHADVLTLRLQTTHPLEDTPPRTIVVRVPLYPGSRPLASSLDGPPIFTTGSRYEKSAEATYRAPAPPVTVGAWYCRVLTQQGYIVSCDGHGSTNDDPLWTYIVADSPTSPATARHIVGTATGPEVQVIYRADPHGGTVVDYFAYVNDVPARLPESYLPHDITQAEVTDLLGTATAQPRPITRTVTDQGAIATLITVLNKLQRSDGTLRRCGVEELYNQEVALVLTTRASRSIIVTLKGLSYNLSLGGLCHYYVRVANYPPLIDDGEALTVVDALLRLPTSS